MCIKKLGYTLIEVIVVIFIIAVIALIAALSIQRLSHDRSIKIMKEHLIQVIQLARREAILRQAVIRMQLRKEGYRFYLLAANKKTAKTHWVPIAKNGRLPAYNLPKNAHIKIKNLKNKKNYIIFLPNGDVSPCVLVLTVEKKKKILKLPLDGE